MPDARCTRGLMCNGSRSAHMSIQGSGEHPTSPAQWLYGLWRDLPGETASIATVTSGQLSPPKSLTPLRAPGPHAFAVRLCRARQAQTSASTATRPSL